MYQENSSQSVYRHIRDRIITGSLQPGTRLVNRTLGKELGVSPVPVREALHQLVSDGVVEQVPGAGTFVRKLSKEDLIHLYAIRELLEGFAVEKAAQNTRPDQIMELKHECDKGIRIARHIRHEPGHVATPELRLAWLDAELTFHKTVLALAGNPWLSRSIEQLHLLSSIIYAKPRTITLSEVCRTCREHARLVRIIKNGDAIKAKDLMTTHLKTGLSSQLMHISKELN